MNLWDFISNQTPVVDFVNFIASVIFAVASLLISVFEISRDKKLKENEAKQHQQQKENDEKALKTIRDMGEISNKVEELNKLIEERNKCYTKMLEFCENQTESDGDNDKQIKCSFFEVREIDDDLFQGFLKIKKSAEDVIYEASVNSKMLNELQCKFLYDVVACHKPAFTTLINAHTFFEKTQGKEKQVLVKDMGELATINARNIKNVQALYNNLIQCMFLFRVSLGFNPREESIQENK